MNLMTFEELKTKAAQAGELPGAREVIITGMWAWVSFETKPGEEVRKSLKANGWRWSHKKGKWYLKGKLTSSKGGFSIEEIQEKYGVLQVA